MEGLWKGEGLYSCGDCMVGWCGNESGSGYIAIPPLFKRLRPGVCLPTGYATDYVHECSPNATAEISAIACREARISYMVKLLKLRSCFWIFCNRTWVPFFWDSFQPIVTTFVYLGRSLSLNRGFDFLVCGFSFAVGRRVVTRGHVKLRMTASKYGAPESAGEFRVFVWDNSLGVTPEPVDLVYVRVCPLFRVPVIPSRNDAD